jgi:hypothetical protein
LGKARVDLDLGGTPGECVDRSVKYVDIARGVVLRNRPAAVVTSMTIQLLCRFQFEGLRDRIGLGRALTRLNTVPEGLGQRQMFGARQERVRSPGGEEGLESLSEFKSPDTRS